jgi:hypothetical protein
LYWDVHNSAFDRNWKAQGLLWVNPPFQLLPQVVDKLEKEQATALLLCPEWPTATWWDKVKKMSTRSYYFPKGSRLFEDDKGRLGPTRWGVWVMYINPSEGHTKRVRVLQGKEGWETQLKIAVSLLVDEKTVVPECTALIDTGAEICVIQKGIIPPELLSPAKNLCVWLAQTNGDSKGEIKW